jgi:hypothetical protein
MTNFYFLSEECNNYKKNYSSEDEYSKLELDFDYMPLVWGMTPFESFKKIILSVKIPKRFVVFGCSIGYQCFYFNHLFPDIPCIGIDIMPFRVNWGCSMIDKYLINNVNLYVGDIKYFQPEDGDLIWQNNLMFDDDFIKNLNYDIFAQKDVEVISYRSLLNTRFQKLDYQEFMDKNGDIKVIKENQTQVETSWTHDQEIYYYWKYTDDNFYDVSFIKPEFIIPEKYLKDYDTMNYSKQFVKSDDLNYLRNKYNSKMKFIEFGFNAPELYFYSKDKCDLKPIISNLKTFVAKPSHFSESVDIFIKKNINQKIDIDYLNIKLNDRIDISDKRNWRTDSMNVDIDWKDTERGIIVEEYINIVYELKVFVVFGEPIIGDLRTGSTELYNVDFIKKENSYLNWDKEYELIKKFAKSLKIDFFRIDFLYDGNKLYASELSFMPGNFLPENIKELIGNKLRWPYLRYYYPNLC